VKMKCSVGAAFFVFAFLLAVSAFAGTGSGKDSPAPAAAATAAGASTQDEDMRLEGEKRFRSNCGRCHMAPPKFPPRMVATIVRHMRVRANITEEERRQILYYMSQ